MPREGSTVFVRKSVISMGLLLLASTTGNSWSNPELLPGKRAVEDFEVVSDLVFEIDGKPASGADIFSSQREVAYLIVDRELAILVSPRGKSVQRVELEKLSRFEGGEVRLEENAAVENLGRYRLEGEAMDFEVDGQSARIRPRPPLVGLQSYSSVGTFDPKYAYGAESYRLTKSLGPGSLPVPGESVRIRVYFGSWSEICAYLVPKVMKVEEEWKSSGVRFEYYGLPRPLIDDPVAVQEGIRGVPTAVVYVDGEEIGRLTGRSLDTPETSLYEMLSRK